MRDGRVDVQRVVLVPTGSPGDPALTRPRRGIVLTAPDPAAQARAETLGLPVEVCPDLAAPAPDGADPERAHHLEALVRRYAVADRWRDVVVVADAATVGAAVVGLCHLPGTTTPVEERGVLTLGLPRGPRRVGLLPTLAGAGLLALLTLVLLDRVYPLALPAAVAAAGLVLLLPPRVRHMGRALLAVAGLAAAAVFVVVAGATRFPVQ